MNVETVLEALQWGLIVTGILLALGHMQVVSRLVQANDVEEGSRLKGVNVSQVTMTRLDSSAVGSCS